MPYEIIRYEVADTGVATVTLDDPGTRNSMSNQLLGELIDAIRAAGADESVRCVVLASSHDKVFSSGGNVAQFSADTPLVHRHFATERFVRLFRVLGELGKPTICAVNGHVLAGALGLALACDLIIAKDTAEFGTPEINLGLFPFMIMALIYRNVPRKTANQMLLLGGRRRGGDRRAARARKAHRARAPRPADRRGDLRGAGDPRTATLLPARDGGRRGAGRRGGDRLRTRRRPARGGRGLRLHGHGGVDGDDRRAQGLAPARAGAAEADAV